MSIIVLPDDAAVNFLIRRTCLEGHLQQTWSHYLEMTFVLKHHWTWLVFLVIGVVNDKFVSESNDVLWDYFVCKRCLLLFLVFSTLCVFCSSYWTKNSPESTRIETLCWRSWYVFSSCLWSSRDWKREKHVITISTILFVFLSLLLSLVKITHRCFLVDEEVLWWPPLSLFFVGEVRLKILASFSSKRDKESVK